MQSLVHDQNRRLKRGSAPCEPDGLPGRGLALDSTGKAAYVGGVREEGDNVEADDDTVEAELTIAAA
jgi:hypothetical protein